MTEVLPGPHDRSAAELYRAAARFGGADVATQRPATARARDMLWGTAALFRRLCRGKHWRRVRGFAGRGRPYPWEASYPKGVEWALDIDARPLFAVLDDAVAAYPDNPCLEFLGKKYTYREVGALVAKAAKGFQELGVTRGVKVGLLLPNCPYFVICYHAVLKVGGTVVNFNPLYAAPGVTRQIRDSETRIMVTMNLKSLYPKVEGRLADTCLEKVVVCRMRDVLPFPESTLFAILKRKEIAAVPDDDQHVSFDSLTANDGDARPVDIDPHRDIAVLQYTGGTTGLPKGAKLTHANLYANTMQTRAWASGIRLGEERMLAVLPLFHVFGMTGVMNLGLLTGGELILLPHFKVGEVLRAIHRQRPTVFMGVPTMYSAINGRKDLDAYDLSSLAYCISGGAPLLAEVKETFERLTGCTLVEGYGLSEAGPVCTINPIAGGNPINGAAGDDVRGSIGLPVPGTIVDILTLGGPARTLPFGEHGEICVSGPQVMAGYWNADEESRAALRDGRLHTGDVGYMDENGYVYLIDRIKDLIITGGFNVYPRMVEEAIHLHPAVEEAAVCGIPSRHRGETVMAFVKLRDGMSLKAADLRAFLKDRLAPFEIPRKVAFRDEIPKTLVGKPLRRRLVAEELRRRDGEDAPSESAEGGGAA